MAVQSDVMEAAGPYDRARALSAFKLGDVTFYWITRACAISVLLHPRRHHRLADRRRLAGDEGIRLRLPVDLALGAVRRSAGARRARPDLRHADHLGHRDDDRHSGRPRHRDFPDRALPAMAAPPDRHCGRTARRHSLDHLRHVGLLRAGPVPGQYVPAVHDQHVRRRAGARHHLRRSAVLSQPVQRRADPRDHGAALHHRDLGRRVQDGAAGAEGSRLRRRLHHLGSRPQRRDPLHPRRRDRRHHAGARPRARRDHGGDLHHRQFVPDLVLDLRAGHHDLGGDRHPNSPRATACTSPA